MVVELNKRPILPGNKRADKNNQDVETSEV